MESIYLQGSEDVKNASHRMKDAADSMQRAVDSLDYSLQQFRMWAEDWLVRFQQMMEQKK